MSVPATGTEERPLPRTPNTAERTTRAEALRVLTEVLAPTIGIGVIARRPRAMALAQRAGLDQRAVRVLQDLRSRRGSDPVHLRVAGRDLAVLLADDDVQKSSSATPRASRPPTPRRAQRCGTSNRTGR